MSNPRSLYVQSNTAPGVGDDTDDGYIIGDRWLDTTADKEYVCLDVTAGAAVWTETTAVSTFGFSSTISSLGSETGSVANGDTLLQALAKVNDRALASHSHAEYAALTGATFTGPVSGSASTTVPAFRHSTNIGVGGFGAYGGLYDSGQMVAHWWSSQVCLRAGMSFGWTSNATTTYGQNLDTGLKRLAAATIGPIADNTHDLGDGSNRFQDIYATNATIQTSDADLKTDVVDISLGLDFINRLRPVTYKFKDYDYDVTVTDPETGEETTETRRKTYTRDHAGLIAQEVATALTESGVDPANFAAYVDTSVKTGTGYKALRYEEFIACLIKAVQELSARVTELEAMND